MRNTRAAAKMGSYSERQVPETRSTRSRPGLDLFRVLVTGGNGAEAMQPLSLEVCPVPGSPCATICIVFCARHSARRIWLRTMQTQTLNPKPLRNVERGEPLLLSRSFSWFLLAAEHLRLRGCGQVR